MDEADRLIAAARSRAWKLVGFGVAMIAVAMVIPGGACVFMPVGVIGLLATATGVSHLLVLPKS